MLRPALAGIAVLAALTLALPASAAAALTKPTLRVTAKSQTTISVAWTAPRDAVRYEVNLWQGGAPVPVPKTQTSFTFTGLRPNGQYYAWVVAFDARGNKAFSNQVTVVTDADRTPPSTPANVRVTGTTASKVSVAWDASSDDAGIAEYQLALSPSQGNTLWTSPTSVDIVGLAPSTTFTIAVRARDFGYNLSPFSAPVSATTLASTDTTPPSAPTNLRVDDADGCGEVGLSWTQSTDDQDPQAALRYEVLINGAPDPLGQFPLGVGRWITYGVVDGAYTFVLRATDSAGNVSAPSAPFTLDLNLC
jgi:chitodextrinase